MSGAGGAKGIAMGTLGDLRAPVRAYCAGHAFYDGNRKTPGGWCAVVVGADGEARVVSGGEAATSDDAMALTAATRALLELSGDAEVEVVTASEALANAGVWVPGWKKRGWKTWGGTSPKNLRAWKALDVAMQGRAAVTFRASGEGDREVLNEAHAGALEEAQRAAEECGWTKPIPYGWQGGEAPAGPEVLVFVSATECLGWDRDGGHAAAIVRPDGSEPQVVSGGAEETSHERETLKGIIAGLRATKAEEVLLMDIRGSLKVLTALEKGWVPGWRSRGWATTTGGTVWNGDLWGDLDDLVKGRWVRWWRTQAHVDAQASLKESPWSVARGEENRVGEARRRKAGVTRASPVPVRPPEPRVEPRASEPRKPLSLRRMPGA